MKMANENIEKLFKEEMDDFLVSPDLEMEGLIMEQIEFESDRSNKKRGGLFLLWGLLLLTSCCVAYTWSWHQVSNSDKMPLSIKGRALKMHFAKVKLPNFRRLGSTNYDGGSMSGDVLSIGSENGGSKLVESGVVGNERVWSAYHANMSRGSKKEELGFVCCTPSFPFGVVNMGPFVLSQNLNLLNSETPLIKRLPDDTRLGESTISQESTNIEEESFNRKSYKHLFGFGTSFSVSVKNGFEIAQGDTSWIGNRSPVKNLYLLYRYKSFLNLEVSGGFEMERSFETWSKSYDTSYFVTTDTIIDGEPAIITYLKEVAYKTEKRYRSTNIVFPISLGYALNVSSNFFINFSAGGLFRLNFVREKTSLLNSSSVGLVKKQRSISFSPKYNLGFNYAVGQIGVGVRLEYSSNPVGNIDLFERVVDRKNIGVGIGLFYRF